MPPNFRTLEEASRWATEHDARHLREDEEQKRDLKDAIKGATRHIDGVAAKQDAQIEAQNAVLKQHTDSLASVTKSLESIASDVKAVSGLSTSAVDELRLARDERIARKAADDERARIAKEKADAEEVEEKLRESRNRRRAIWIPVILALIGIVTALIASGASHH